MTNKIILTDVDGVLLNWHDGFREWMEFHRHSQVHEPEPWRDKSYDISVQFGITPKRAYELIVQYNESAAIGFLKPLRDAAEIVPELVSRGYRFIAITSVGIEPHVKQLRRENLARVFGNDAFIDVICLDTGACKRSVLEQYAKHYPNHLWIEDKIENADIGAELGFHSVLVQHEYNTHYSGPATVVHNWHDIRALIS